MRRTPLSLVAAFVLLAGGVVTTRSAASAGAVPSCSSSSVRVSEYNSWVGAGNVNLLFWIRNVQAQSCTVRGYVRVAYVGVYGLKSGPLHHVHTLSVRVEDAMNGGANGNDFGGIRSGPIPVVTLAPHGVASFWVYGTDEPVGAPPVRCITSYRMKVWLAGASRADSLRALRANGFYWCGGVRVHPVVAGESGTRRNRFGANHWRLKWPDPRELSH